MERKEAIRSAYRMTRGNKFDHLLYLERKSGVPPCLGYESGGMRCLSGKCVVRYPGTFLRQTAGGAGGNRNFDHLKRRKYRLFYTRKILLVFAKYPSSSLFSDTP